MKGEGKSVNYKYRMHDPRIGRFFAIDPLAENCSHNSPYAFSENIVIHGRELEGLEVAYDFDSGEKLTNEDNRALFGPDWSADNTDVYTVQDFESYTLNDVTQSSYKNLKPVGVNEDDFLRILNTVYGEVSGANQLRANDLTENYWMEAAGITSVLENRARSKGTSVAAQASSGNGVYGSTSLRGSESSNPEAIRKQKYVFQGVVGALRHDKDYSNGAYYWDGVDYPSTDRYLGGTVFTNDSHDLFGLGNNTLTTVTKNDNISYDHKYETTAAFGGTTFSRLTDDYRDAQYQDVYKNGKLSEKRYLVPAGAGYTTH